MWSTLATKTALKIPELWSRMKPVALRLMLFRKDHPLTMGGLALE
jgi:hypothetical protein